MQRDNFLFLLIGTLAGFLLGYVLQEQISQRQPALRTPTAASGSVSNSAVSAGGPAAAAPMEEVQKLRAYVEQNPKDSGAVRELANLNYDIGNWQRAAELYEQFLILVPNDADAMTDLGACLRNLGRANEALAIFRQIKEQAPGHWQARFNEILILAFDLGQWKAASSAAEELKLLQPANPDVERLAAEIQRNLQ